MRRVYAAPDLQSAWYRLVRDLLRDGRVSAPRGSRTREFVGVDLVLTDPTLSVITDPLRKLNQAFAAAEFCWIMAGDDRVELISRFNSRVAEFADAGQFFGAYGPKVAAQLPYVLWSLRDEDSRQAVVNIWRESPPRSRDIPCTLSLQFLLRGGKLMLIVTMRSNDAYLGTPYDVQVFTRVQSWVASQLSVGLGEYHHVVGSMHLYERDFDTVSRILDALPSPHPPGRVEVEFNAVTPRGEAWWLVGQESPDPERVAVLGSGWDRLYATMRAYLDRKRRP